VVGSAIVQVIEQNLDASAEDLAAAVERLARQFQPPF
jgi:tryptophan synthase alpha subunit